ncbi:efflux RND transporter permease subunit [Zavarzinia compransoris]|uniref:Acriflavine resistance protein B n=1 Tax=Zavarzinia compransoris TaxID=1264899 RepID=A0A317E5Z0_9PROT|nr:efflux RND transporter permease subunit [Zavarzinia compransoris]PWR22032.1 acriflavine resistance protein B [Zavarzinia compransoris]TDP47227.1 multidrug efflux pump/multidrug efflux pump [Zavarzinia compransoris]
MISDPFIRRPVASTLVMIGVMLLGFVAYFHLPVASMPVVDLPTVVVRASLPGASPETMAAAVATPLERQLGVIGGLTELTSINSVGGSTIVAQFDIDRDIDGVARDVQAAINAAAATLPADLPAPPFYIKANPNIFPVITMALASDILPAASVYDIADQILTQKLSQIPGVSQVSVSGADKTAVRVALDPVRLAALGLSTEDVRSALSAVSAMAPKGSLDGPEKSLTIAANDQLPDAAAFAAQVIAWRGNGAIRLRDVAEVTDDVTNAKVGSWLNGKRAVLVEVRKRPGANTIDVVDAVHAKLAEVRPLIPPAIEVQVVADRTKILRAGIVDLQLTLLLSTALVIMVIALFLRRFWATFIPSVTIPVAVAGTFAVMYLLGYSLDNLSIMALILAIGFIVDDTIVMIENVFRLIEQGETPMAAAARGARQIAFTVVSLTASLLAALVPILFMPGILGRFFQEFGVTLAVAIVLSAFISLTITPMMCGHLLPPRGREKPEGRTSAAIERFFTRLTDGYGRSLDAALTRPWTMLGVVVVAMVLGLSLFGVVPQGFLPKQDTGVIKGITDGPPDISFEAMRDRQGEVVRMILADPAVASVSSAVGVGLFNAMNNGSITVNLKGFGERDLSAAEVVERLRPKLARVYGIDTYLSPVDDFAVGGRAGRAAYQYTLTGPDLAKLETWVSTMRDIMRGMPELADVSTDQNANGRSAHLTIDRESAARLGVSTAEIDIALYNAFGQRQVATIYKEFDQAKVVLEVRASDRGTLDVLNRLYVTGRDGAQVPLAAVTRLETGLSPVQINHMGQLPAITIGFNLGPGVALGTAMDAIRAAAGKANAPPGITGLFAGDAKAAADANRAQGWMLLGAIVAIYLVLGMLYESYAHPLTILSTIPSSGVGALLALLVTGTEFSFIAAIALILLIGIVMKNAIMMVDFALVAERELGLSPRDAIVRAAKLRFRPITMTTMAAVFGAVPLAIGVGIGSELRQPLGIAIVGGLIAAQFVTIYTTPVVYIAVDRMRGRRRSRWLPADLPAE